MYASARVQSMCLLRQGRDRTLAGVEALLAGVGADPAMLVSLGMLAALVGAHTASERTCSKLLRDELFVRARSAASDRSARRTHVRAIEIQANALREIGDGLLAEASVRAGDAGLRAVIAMLDAIEQRVVGHAPNVRMAPDHFLNVHGSLRFR